MDQWIVRLVLFFIDLRRDNIDIILLPKDN